MSAARRRPGRVVTAVLGVAAAATAVAGPPAHAAGGRPGLDGPRPDAALLERCTGTDPVLCTFPDLPPGHYDVTVMLGDRRSPASTEVRAEARRLMVPAVDTAHGELARRTFTVNVRDPESQQNQPAGEGTPGLTLTFTGDDPRVAGIGIRAACPRTPRLALLGDSTVTDQGGAPYTGWGQRLLAHFGLGVSVVNHSGSGESTVSVLAKPEMFDALVPQLRPGDLALVQLAHNDKTTTAEQYRANLTEIVARVRATGATPVLVTPIVRLRFDGDQLSSVGMIETAAGSLPQHVRDVAADLDVDLIDLTALSEELVEGLGPVDAQPIYLVRENGDRTHTSWYGAGVYADLVAGELRRLGLVPERFWR